MKLLRAVHLVQFSFWQYETFLVDRGGTAFIGANGAGKTSLVDAIQIALLGANRNAMQFNAQSVHRDRRTLRDYALGSLRTAEGDRGTLLRKRDQAVSYITVVFEDESTGHAVSAGLALAASINSPEVEVLGLYVLPGVRLLLEHHLEDRGEEGKAPQDWKVFEALIRSQSAAAGMSPTITSKSERYLDELLHNLADRKQTIDPRKFQKALKQSIRLKDVNSVGDFLREHLVDATRIDKKGTLLHIKTLRRLSLQILEVRQQIGELDSVAARYKYLQRQHRLRAVAAAVSLQLRLEAADALLSNAKTRIEELMRHLATAQELARLKETEVATTFEAYESLHAAYQRDPEAAVPEQGREILKARQKVRVKAQQAVEELDLLFAEALTAISLAFDGRYVAEVEGAAVSARQWEGRRKQGVLVGLEEASRARRFIEGSKSAIDHILFTDTDALRRATLAREAVLEKLEAAGKGVRLRDDDLASAMRLLSREGLTCNTVSSLVSVRDLNWQGPIETFLGRNRFAIVVKSGQERAAVALIRANKIPEITIVQPSHLGDAIGRVPDAGTVGDLLVGDDKVALAFLRRILGNMRCVDSVEELERHSRAMTTDYMLSANGGTRRMRPIDAANWVLGVRVSSADIAEIEEELKSARKTETAAQRMLQLSQSAKERSSHVLRDVSLTAVAAALGELKTALAHEAAAAAAQTPELSERLKALQIDLQNARDLHTNTQRAHADAVGRASELTRDLETANGTLCRAQEELDRLTQAYAAATAEPDYDAESAAEKIGQLYLRDPKQLEETFALLKTEHSRADSSITKLLPEIASQFTDFINKNSIDLIDERSDWRKASKWVEVYAAKLRDSTLVEYERQADEARKAAERAFEHDVRYSLREAVRRVEREIKDLNDILNRCPPFTNGEHYQFLADIDSTHKPLYDLITDDTGGASRLLEDGALQSALLKLLEAAESGDDKDNNPLEDYRLFYRFDLEILANKKRIDLLSQRMGVASNGEHRVPFHVIAGAALATAYRIKPGADHPGAGLMILDEAFYGIDAQNTVVTAEFLKYLGLQLVMAAPDSDTSKLEAVMDSYHALDRFGADVVAEHIVVKPPARELMQSDMPSRHPHLVDQKMAELLASAK